jgi:hypothetical protein
MANAAKVISFRGKNFGRYLLETVREITGRHFFQMKIPFDLAKFAAMFTPMYYSFAKVNAAFYALFTGSVESNSNISHAKATRELGIHRAIVRKHPRCGEVVFGKGSSKVVSGKRKNKNQRGDKHENRNRLRSRHVRRGVGEAGRCTSAACSSNSLKAK